MNEYEQLFTRMPASHRAALKQQGEKIKDNLAARAVDHGRRLSEDSRSNDKGPHVWLGKTGQLELMHKLGQFMNEHGIHKPEDLTQ